MLVEHLKALGLGCDLRPDDRYFFFSSTSWMVWNFLVAGLMHGTTIILYDGSPGHPDLLGTWRIAERTEATIVGAGAAYLSACAKAAIEPGRALDVGRVRQIISTGSPLPASAWNWAYKSVGPDIWLQSLSGGTDICSAFAGGSPMLPVHAGEIACRWLGVALNAWDPSRRPLVNAVGELVVTEPMPSMPIRFWNDPDGSRYRAAYFEYFPGIWRHGDWVTVSTTGAITISGRSDSTLNRQGVRMGSADIYTVVEALAEVADSLVVGVELPEGEYWMPLFIVPAEDIEFGPELRDKIKHAIRDRLSPRHVPDEIVCAPAVPRTLTGKKLEVPIKRILQGTPVNQVTNQDSIDNAAALQWYAEIGERRLEAAAEPQTC
jgi:acetoacetyl-CoA synthetase